MLFNRRTPPRFIEKLRVLLWPRRNWWRSFKYMAKRVMRLSASPHVIAIGVASGVFASITPFLGFHFLIAFIIAYLLRGNLIASALGTAVGNPLTFPFIWISTYQLGNTILKGHSGHLDMEQLKDLVLKTSWGNLVEIIKPMSVGAIPIGVMAALIFYFIIRRIVFVYQHSRLGKLAHRAETKMQDTLLHNQDTDSADRTENNE